MRIFVIIILLILSRCSVTDEINVNQCQEIRQNPDWKTVQFKNAHTIQFPDSYTGNGLVGFEGNTFYMERKDGKVTLSYFYCGPLWCDEFGKTISSENPTFIFSKDRKGLDIKLDRILFFCFKGEIKGIFYYDSKTEATGSYYLAKDKGYSEAVNISFNQEALEEVIDILSTISLSECRDDIVCTEVFVSIVVKILRPDGQIYKAKQVYVEFDNTGDRKLIHQDANGNVPVITDGDIGRLKKEGSMVTLIGIDDKNMQVINEKYIAGHDCCHVKKIEGKDSIIVK